LFHSPVIYHIFIRVIVVVDVGGTSSKLMADQIMTADKNRLKKYINVLNSDDMAKVEDTVRLHLGL